MTEAHAVDVLTAKSSTAVECLYVIICTTAAIFVLPYLTLEAKGVQKDGVATPFEILISLHAYESSYLLTILRIGLGISASITDVGSSDITADSRKGSAKREALSQRVVSSMKDPLCTVVGVTADIAAIALFEKASYT